ncbi:MAG: YhbY family RNA-binding protein [Clostridia bacterium]
MITSKQRKALRAMANTLKPLVIVGKGDLTENVLIEIETALYHNELVKVSALKSCSVSAKLMLEEVCAKLNAEPIGSIGNKFIVYKFSDKEKIEHIVI